MRCSQADCITQRVTITLRVSSLIVSADALRDYSIKPTITLCTLKLKVNNFQFQEQPAHDHLLSAISINIHILAFYNKCHLLIGSFTHYLICCR